MDRYEAQYSFWASFGLPTYEQNSVPDQDDVTFPYITYEAVSSGQDTDVQVTASVWTRSLSWLQADTIANSIENRLQNGGDAVKHDGGRIWITPGTPFVHSMGDPGDDRIKRKLLTVQLHFL